MSRLANLYALAFALDAALSLLDGLLGELFGLGSLSAARAWLAARPARLRAHRLRALGALVQQLDAAEIEAVEEDFLIRRNGNLLREIDAALADYRRVVVPWGALHLPEIERGVVERGFRLEQPSRVRLADFGLAAVAEHVAGADIRSGTPAYMSPEQREGREVTVAP